MDVAFSLGRNRQTALRLVKAEPRLTGLPNVAVDADFPCRLMDGPEFFFETELEIVIFLEHPELKDACLARITVDAPEDFDVVAVRCELHNIVFASSKEAGRSKLQFEVDVSGLHGRTKSLNVHTMLSEPGITLRVEQNDVHRVGAHYSGTPWPAMQIDAALHYCFAAREIFRFSGLGRYLNENRLGYMLLLGFETNNPHHPDFPPHWHIVFRWPHFCGSPAPHIYMDDQGGNVANKVYLDAMPGVSGEFHAGEPFLFKDYRGGDILSLTVEHDGGLHFRFTDGTTYQLARYDARGGIFIRRNGAPFGRVRCTNDIVSGAMSVLCEGEHPSLASYAETIRYDPVSGGFLSSSQTSTKKRKGPLSHAD